MDEIDEEIYGQHIRWTMQSSYLINIHIILIRQSINLLAMSLYMPAVFLEIPVIKISSVAVNKSQIRDLVLVAMVTDMSSIMSRIESIRILAWI